MQLSSPLRNFARYIGAHAAPGRREHELDRARQRIVACLVVGAVWAVDHFLGQLDRARAILVVVDCVYLSASLLYLYLLRSERVQSAAPVYFFLLADPFLLTLVLALDPRAFAFTNPLLLVVIVDTGIRYGVRTMVLSWATTLLASAMLLATPFWRENVELTLAFFLMLALVPTLFSSLIGKLHGARTIEDERARLAATSEAIRARSSFLAKVSHELRSPLQGIVSALDVLALRQGPKASADDELIQRIRRSSLLLNTLCAIS